MKIKNIKKILTMTTTSAAILAIAFPIAFTTSCSTPTVDKKLLFDQSINFASIYGSDFKQKNDDGTANEIFTKDSKIFAWDITSSLTKYVLQFLVDPTKNIDSNYMLQGEIVNNSVANNKYNLDVSFKLNKTAIWDDAGVIKNIESFNFKMSNATLSLTNSAIVNRPVNMNFSVTDTSSLIFNYSYFTINDKNEKIDSNASILDNLSTDPLKVIFSSNYLTKTN